MFSSRQSLRKLAFAVAAGTSIGILGLTNAVDYNQIMPVRMARAGITVTEIVIDYKWSFARMKHPVNSPEYLQELSEIHKRSAERLKRLCCKNGGVFIKVGQHAGSLDYLLPPEYVDTMKSLFRDAPKSKFEDMLAVLRSDLKQNPMDVFSEIDPIPIGAASLAQVHRAVLRDGNQTVAVKIQHPKVESQSRMDIKAMKLCANIVAYIFPEFKFLWLAEETERIVPLELDFLHEGRNCERLEEMLSKFNFVKLPKIYWMYSTKRVLTMEYCEGGWVDDLSYYKAHKISPNQVFSNISKLFNEMIFVDGYIHCDPHPGNILISKNADGAPIISLLDHGIHLRLTEKTRVAYSKLWLSMLCADVPGMRNHAEELGVGELFDLFACMLTGRSWAGVRTGIQNSIIGEKEMQDIKMKVGKLLPEISDVLNRIPREVLLILKTNDLLRGLSYKLKLQHSPSMFSSASTACTKSCYFDKLDHAKSFWDFATICFSLYWMLLKIKCFEIYLKIFPTRNPLVM